MEKHVAKLLKLFSSLAGEVEVKESLHSRAAVSFSSTLAQEDIAMLVTQETLKLV